jgi:hypothetical protein
MLTWQRRKDIAMSGEYDYLFKAVALGIMLILISKSNKLKKSIASEHGEEFAESVSKWTFKLAIIGLSILLLSLLTFFLKNNAYMGRCVAV